MGELMLLKNELDKQQTAKSELASKVSELDCMTHDVVTLRKELLEQEDRCVNVSSEMSSQRIRMVAQNGECHSEMDSLRDTRKRLERSQDDCETLQKELVE